MNAYDGEAELTERVKLIASELEVSARSVGNVELETLAAEIRRKASEQLEELAPAPTPHPGGRIRSMGERKCCRCGEYRATAGGSIRGPRRTFVCAECIR